MGYSSLSATFNRSTSRLKLIFMAAVGGNVFIHPLIDIKQTLCPTF